jgi:hypothetical protein
MLQNLGMVDGDDKNDMEDMEYMEHQGEDESCVENHGKQSQQENKRRKNQQVVDRSYGNS